MTQLDKETDLLREIVHKNNRFKRINRRRRVFWIMILIILSYLLYTFFFSKADPLQLEEIIYWGVDTKDSISQ